MKEGHFASDIEQLRTEQDRAFFKKLNRYTFFTFEPSALPAPPAS
jgi:hypothetical protein